MAYTMIRGGLVLAANARRAERMDLLIEDGRIVEMGTFEGPAEAEILAAEDRLVMPGLVNAHTHGHGSLHRGRGDRWTLEHLLNAGPWISANRTLEHKYLAALLSAIDMVEKGCTAAYDLYVELPMPSVEGMQAVARAYADVGMRAVIAPLFADRTFFEAVPGLAAALPERLREKVEAIVMSDGEVTLAACRELLAAWPYDRDRLRPALGPTIPQHCSDEFLLATARLAEEFDVGLHTHLGESKVQAVTGLARYGKTLTAHLDELGLLGPRFTAAHAVWLDAEDMKRLADNGSSVAHNPGSNMRLGSGLAPVREMLAAGINVGIGTDGSHCSDNQNMFEAMRFASFVSRVRSHDVEAWLATDEVLGMATVGSARLLGMEGVGELARGASADLVLLDLSHADLVPLNDAVNQLVHAQNGGAVDVVMVGGEVIARQGRVLGVDRDKVRADAAAAVEALGEANRGLLSLASELEAHVGQFCLGLARTPYHVHALAGVDY